MDIYEKINGGYYTNKLERGNKHKNPDGYVAYRAEQDRIDEEFKKDALEYVGLSNHPKREKVWAMAYDHVHGVGGFHDRVRYLEELSSLLID